MKLRPWRLNSPGQAAKPYIPIAEPASTPLPLPHRGDFPPSLTRVHLPLHRRGVDDVDNAGGEPAPQAGTTGRRRPIHYGAPSDSISILSVPLTTPSAPALTTAPSGPISAPPPVADPPSSLVTTGLVTAEPSEATPDAKAAVSEGRTSTVVVIATPTEPTEVVVSLTSTARLQSPSALLQSMTGAGLSLGVEGWKVVTFGLVGALMLA